MSKLKQAKWASFENGNFKLIGGEQIIQMKHSYGTALPLVVDDSIPNKFGADIIRFPAGKGVGLHTHIGAHILMVTKGTGILTYGEEKHQMFPGMIYLVPSNVPHAIEATTGLVLVAIGNDHRPADSEEGLELANELNLIENYEGFKVINGSVIQGGLKSIILTDLLLSGEIQEEEIVYCADPYGHSQLALAVASYKSGKKATLFTACSDTTPQQEEARRLGNTTFNIVEGLKHQSELPEIAKKYAEDNHAYYMPIGYDFELFNKRLIEFAQSLSANPEEVWVPAGSGTTFRALRKAWPNAKICAVNLGMMPNVNLEGSEEVYKVFEARKQKAISSPPYNSNPWYDAKCWQFIKKHAKKGALIWNIA